MRINKLLVAAIFLVSAASSWAVDITDSVSQNFPVSNPQVDSGDYQYSAGVILENGKRVSLMLFEKSQARQVSLHILADSPETLTQLTRQRTSQAPDQQQRKLSALLHYTNKLFPDYPEVCQQAAVSAGALPGMDMGNAGLNAMELSDLKRFLLGRIYIEIPFLYPTLDRFDFHIDTPDVSLEGTFGWPVKVQFVSNFTLKEPDSGRVETIASMVCNRVLGHYQDLGWNGLNSYFSLHPEDKQRMIYNIDTFTDERRINQLFADLSASVQEKSRGLVEGLKVMMVERWNDLRN